MKRPSLTSSWDPNKKGSWVNYILLGIKDPSIISMQEIKKAFRYLILRFHPDKSEAEKVFYILKDAYEYVQYQKKELAEKDIQNNIFREKFYPNKRVASSCVKRFSCQPSGLFKTIHQ